MKGVLLKSISLDVTYRCNFRCLHCFNSSGEHQSEKEELTDEQLIAVATQIGELNVETLCFCGGETLLRFEAICVATRKIREKNQKININMVSNGYFMTSEVAHELKKAGISFVQISLDGARKETYEWLRNKADTYEHAINAIKNLVLEGIPVGVAFTPTKKNIAEIEDAVKVCSDMGVVAFRVQPIMELGRAKNIKELYLNEKEYFKLSSNLKRLMNQYNGKMNIEWGDPVLHIIAGRNRTVSANYFTISAYGDIGISPYLPVSFGNVTRHSLEEYIRSGLLDVWQRFEFLQYLTEGINSANNLDVSKHNSKLPAIFTDSDYVVDLIECDDLREKDMEIVDLIKE